MGCFPGSFFFLGFSIKYKLLRVHSRRIERLSLWAASLFRAVKEAFPMDRGSARGFALGRRVEATVILNCA